MKKIKVQIVGDQQMVSTGLKMILENNPDMSVPVLSNNGEQAIKDYADTKSTVVVLDLDMPGMGGMEVARRLIKKFPDVRILALSHHINMIIPTRALRAGVFGYLTKHKGADELVAAVRKVAEGVKYIEPELAQMMVVGDMPKDGEILEKLSSREFEIFLMLSECGSTSEIARMLNISPKTVANHQYNISQKLKLPNKAELVRLAIQFKLM